MFEKGERKAGPSLPREGQGLILEPGRCSILGTSSGSRNGIKIVSFSGVHPALFGRSANIETEAFEPKLHAATQVHFVLKREYEEVLALDSILTRVEERRMPIGNSLDCMRKELP